ncbi:MAG: hypothetical protein M1821_009270 [Bathelium mastoideum]|nr:MAG: hypothetical protein M1821_009270 [Bathelium mastoideum]
MTLVDHYKISHDILHMLSGFRDRFLPTEEAFSGAVRSLSTLDRSEISYVYKYSERKMLKEGNSWVVRQTGLYHLYDRKRAVSVFVILSPSPDAKFKNYLEDVLRDREIRSHMLANPALLHTMLISTHLSTWREYFEHYETRLLKAVLILAKGSMIVPSLILVQNNQAACAALGEPLVNLETLKTVRSVETHLLPLEPVLKSLQKLLSEMKRFNSTLETAQVTEHSPAMVIPAALTDFEKEAACYREHASYLIRRAQSTAQSILDTLNLDSQTLAHCQSDNMFVLARAAQEDSVTIRVITLVTLFYLPFSFVATILGMNLFEFNTNTRKITVSNEFWLYFVISIPLTALTLGCWKWKMWRHRMKHASTAEGLMSRAGLDIV